jgi:sarcosine oxidase subunit gamma
MTDHLASASPIHLAELRWAFAWNVRGDPSASTFVSEAQRVSGLGLPLEPCTGTRTAPRSLLWLGPRSWLWIDGAAGAAPDFNSARRALNAVGGALFDLSAAYAGWLVSGALAATVLNRGCPLDLRPRVFEPGRCAQSLLGHIPALFYKPNERPLFVVMVPRSLATDGWHHLRGYAEAEGCAIDAAAPFGHFDAR